MSKVLGRSRHDRCWPTKTSRGFPFRRPNICSWSTAFANRARRFWEFTTELDRRSSCSDTTHSSTIDGDDQWVAPDVPIRQSLDSQSNLHVDRSSPGPTKLDQRSSDLAIIESVLIRNRASILLTIAAENAGSRLLRGFETSGRSSCCSSHGNLGHGDHPAPEPGDAEEPVPRRVHHRSKLRPSGSFQQRHDSPILRTAR